ncbi:hypothetical protein [Parachlamydia sp. AcF125]|uniref:hypothetical protein n=1 Tax=Parachlamydia sp. AcF125 TaxID=2795736 RepID=UPI001BC924DC|nr:hypothetical protein [Parachlamydia sp. AcF125]MBS4168196.1 hypothetical protein [Parachlamydia sp. AcF125]
MNPIDYILLLSSFVLFPLVNRGILCFSGDLTKLHSESDLFRMQTEKQLAKIDQIFYSRWIPPLFLTALSSLFHSYLNWNTFDTTGIVRGFIVFICGMITWKAVSLDRDLVTDKPSIPSRIALLATLCGVYVYPGFIVLFLFLAIHYCRSWYHHQLMALRILQMFASLLAITALASLGQFSLQTPYPPHLAVPLFLFLWVIAAHYFYSGVAKMKLGKHWYSWALDNRIHYLALSAYLWGWMRKQNAQTRMQWIQHIAPYDRLFQFAALFFECGWLICGYSPILAQLWCIQGIFFHSLVFILSGIFFWQSICVHFIFLNVLYFLPLETSQALFNGWNALIFAILLVFLLPRHILWKAQKLAWWDSPFAGRIHWYVIGKSGKRYELYNNFLDPHERFFGRHTPFFLIPHLMFHGHLGEVNSPKLRDAIIAANGDPRHIDLLREKCGYYVYHPELEKAHDDYIKKFFTNLNAGKPKRVVPPWLKAPGGQFYYWGQLPPFEGQEPASQVLIFFREEYCDGKKIVLVNDNLLKVIPIS